MSLKRPNWQVSLTKFINSQIGQPFEWGIRDCATFAADCIDEMTVQAIIRPVLTYTDEAGAIEFAKAHNLADILTDQYAAYAVQPGYQTIGDIILAPHDVHPEITAAHVCVGRHSVIPVPGHGVRAIRTSLILAQPGAFILRID